MNKNFWPDLTSLAPVPTPLALLRSFGQDLDVKTAGAITGAITSGNLRDGSFTYTFKLCAPALGGYTIRLFNIEHTIELYPCSLDLEDALYRELEDLQTSTGIYFVEDVVEFQNILERIANSERARRLLTALLSQVMQVPKPDDDLPF